jgi:Ca2+-binding RTX toxin-like protein
MARIFGRVNKSVKGTNSADEIYLSGKADAHGRKGDDIIYGSDKTNKLYGDDGNDSIYTNGGADSAWGGRGNDYIFAENAELIQNDLAVKLYGEAVRRGWG